MSIQQTKTEVRRIEMTAAVISNEPESGKLYKNYGASSNDGVRRATCADACGVFCAGRMYLLEPRADILNKADAAKKTYTTQIEEYMVSGRFVRAVALR